MKKTSQKCICEWVAGVGGALLEVREGLLHALHPARALQEFARLGLPARPARRVRAPPSPATQIYMEGRGSMSRSVAAALCSV